MVTYLGFSEKCGAINDWTGNFSDINGATLDDLTTIVADTNGDTFTRVLTTSYSKLSTETIDSVVINARAKTNETSAVKDLAGAVRVGGVNYLSTAQTLGDGFGNCTYMFANDPATAQPWTEFEINNAEFGLVAQT